MVKFSISLVAFWLLIMLNACYYDKEELLYPSVSACSDTTSNVSYAQKIVPIFTRQCYSCHAGNSPSGNIGMGTYALDKVIAQNGKLNGSITHAPGFVPMPEGAPQLSACELSLISKWINSGMLNN